MVNDAKYIEILKKHNIPLDTSIDSVRRKLAMKMSSFHPDKNPAPDAERKFVEINKDYLYVRELMQRMQKNETSNNNNATKNSSDDVNYTNNSQNKSSNQRTNGFNNDEFNVELENFKKILSETINKYSFIKEIVKYASNLLNYKISSIKNIEELNYYRNELECIIVYYWLIAIIEFNKLEYDDDKINLISSDILNKLHKIKSQINKLYDLEEEYYNRINAILEKIREEIKNKINPIIEIINKIGTFKNIKLDYFFNSYEYTMKLENIKNIKKVDNVINDCFVEIKNKFVMFLDKEYQLYNDNTEYSDYIKTLITQVNNCNKFESLNDLINNYNNYFEKELIYLKQILIDKARECITNSLTNSFRKNSLERDIKYLETIHEKGDFDMYYRRIKENIFQILKDNFMKEIESNDIEYSIKSQYISKLYRVQNEIELNNLMSEYKKYQNKYTEENRNESTLLNNAKKNIKESLMRIREGYMNDMFVSRLDFYIKQIDYCTTENEMDFIIDKFSNELLEKEKNSFLDQLLVNSSYFGIEVYFKYSELLRQVRDFSQLNNLRKSYRQELEQIQTKNERKGHNK